MKRNKGFTLIELLAVIVILAIIALIATPMILGVIDSAKQSSAKSSAQYYVEAVEKSIMTAQMTSGSAVADGTYDVNGKTLTCKSGDCAPADEGTAKPTVDINYKGDTATGEVIIKDGQVTGATLKFSKILDKEVTVNADGSAEIK